MRKRNIDALVYSLFFLLMAISIIYLIVSQNINNYVHIRFSVYLLVSAIVLIVVAISFIRMISKGKHPIQIKELLVMSLLFGVFIFKPTTNPITTKVETLVSDVKPQVTTKKFYEQENLKITNEEYLQWFYDLHTNPTQYTNKSVEFVGKILEANNNQLFVMRNVMFCCAADLVALGFNLDVNDSTQFKKAEWVKVKGIIKVKNDPKFKHIVPYIEVESVQKIEKIKNEIIYP